MASATRTRAPGAARPAPTPNGVTQSATYDASGRPSRLRAAKGATTLTDFASSYARGGTDANLRYSLTSPGGTTTYGYGASSNRTEATTGGATTTAAYDAADRMTSQAAKTFSYLTGSSESLSASYNAAGQTTAIDPADGVSQPCAHHSLRRPLL